MPKEKDKLLNFTGSAQDCQDNAPDIMKVLFIDEVLSKKIWKNEYNNWRSR